MAKTLAEREEAHERLAGFINTPRELLILQAWRLELGKALIFAEFNLQHLHRHKKVKNPGD